MAAPPHMNQENRPITLIGAYIQQKRADHWECAKMRQRLAIEQYLNGTLPADQPVHLIDSFGGKGGKKPITLFYKFSGKPVKIDDHMGMLEMTRVDPEGVPSPGYAPVKVVFIQLSQHPGYSLPPRTSVRKSASAAPRTSVRKSVSTRKSASATTSARKSGSASAK